MADIILKNTSGEIWANTDGKIFKQRKMSETIIQNGLSFWGSADPAFLTIVDGLVSEAYDIRGTGQKMIQTSVANRPSFNNNIVCNGFKRLEKSINLSSSSAFIVCKRLGTTSYFGIGSGAASVLGDNNNRTMFWISSIDKYYYRNMTKYNTTVSSPLTTVILSTVSPFITGSVNLLLGSTATNYGCDYQISEWGWYNRVLTEQEVIYNINALNAKHLVF